jgi:hypothetical protein
MDLESLVRGDLTLVDALTCILLCNRRNSLAHVVRVKLGKFQSDINKVIVYLEVNASRQWDL